MRLLEKPGAVAQHATSPPPPLLHPCSRSPSPSGSRSPRSPSPSAALRYYPERTSPLPSTHHLSAAGTDHSADRPTQQVNIIPVVCRCCFLPSLFTQTRGLSRPLTHFVIFLSRQKMSAREFAGKGIKERADHLSSMFSGSFRPVSSLPEAQVVYHAGRLQHRLKL